MQRRHASYFFPALFAAFLSMQVAYWNYARPFKPDLSIVPNVPRVDAVRAISMGDEEFYFRMLSLTLQNFGDTFGRFTPLKNYDYAKLSKWFHLLDQLNARSNMLPAMAAYYYSQSQYTPDVRYMADFLYEHSIKDVKHKWWWLVQCLYLTMHKLHDQEFTLKVAKPLLNPEVPAWAQQMLAVVYEKRGEMEDALHIMETIRDNATQITDADLKYMRYFIEERIKKLDEWKQRGNKDLP